MSTTTPAPGDAMQAPAPPTLKRMAPVARMLMMLDREITGRLAATAALEADLQRLDDRITALEKLLGAS